MAIRPITRMPGTRVSTEAGIKDRLMHRPNKHHPELPPRQKQRNKLIAKVRAAVERPYAVIKENYGLRRLRFFSFERNHVLIVLACCAYNLRRAAGALAASRRSPPVPEYWG